MDGATAFRIPGGSLPVGAIPRVVGTLLSLPEGFGQPPCDVVEIRLDHVLGRGDWLKAGREIEAAGTPVILTARAQAEGGKWTGPDAERLALYEQALKHLAAVDVELESAICPAVCALAKKAGKLSIVSFHDFEKTPPLPVLEAVAARGQETGAVVKVVTMLRTEADAAVLRELLGKKWKAPLCVMGMGALGGGTRIAFPALGSCLTYGYLDSPAAPGQMSAAEVVEKLRATLPGYEEDFRKRMEAAGESTKSKIPSSRAKL